MSVEAGFDLRRGGFALSVDLELPSRGVTGIVGPSGCGKTTLLRAMSGLDHHPGGVMRVDGEPWQEAGLFVAPHKRSLGFVFQEPSLFEHLDVWGNLRFGYRRVPAARRRMDLDAVIAMLNLDTLLSRRPEGLSGGERQRVAIGRALAASPRILFMDEPLAALDADSRDDILPYLQSLADETGVALIYVSHSRRELARLADHLVWIGATGVQAQGPAARVFTQLDLPHIWESDAGSVISARVETVDADGRSMTLRTGAGRLRLSGRLTAVGAGVRVWVNAREVSLWRERPRGGGGLSYLPVTVEAVSSPRQGHRALRLTCGAEPVLAVIDAASDAVRDPRPGERYQLGFRPVIWPGSVA